MKYLKLSWELIDELTDKIATEVSRNYKEIKFIYGIPRGGLIPAVILSHKLGIKLINEVFSHTLEIKDTLEKFELGEKVEKLKTKMKELGIPDNNWKDI